MLREFSRGTKCQPTFIAKVETQGYSREVGGSNSGGEGSRWPKARVLSDRPIKEERMGNNHACTGPTLRSGRD